MLETQRSEEREPVITLEGVFDDGEARRLLEAVSTLPRWVKVRIDFHEVEFVDEYAFASFAGAAGPGVELVGLSRHLDRLLRYMGPQSVAR